MELEEAKKVLLIIQDKINWELQFKENDIRLQGCINAIDTVIAELHAMQNLLDEKNEELDRLQKENEELSCVKKAIKVYKTNVGTENCQFVLMSESEFLNSFNYKCLLDDYISKNKIKEGIREMKKARDLANELINERVIIADSDSLNFGRKEAHDFDINILQDLLKEE